MVMMGFEAFIVRRPAVPPLAAGRTSTGVQWLGNHRDVREALVLLRLTCRQFTCILIRPPACSAAALEGSFSTFTVDKTRLED
jgi:hypothetical protein